MVYRGDGALHRADLLRSSHDTMTTRDSLARPRSRRYAHDVGASKQNVAGSNPASRSMSPLLSVNAATIRAQFRNELPTYRWWDDGHDVDTDRQQGLHG
jgi:hypothetical protein